MAARAGDDARSNKEADFEANRQAIEKGAGQKAAAGEVDRDHEEAAHAAATATKTHHTARKGSGARSPQVPTQGGSATDFLLGPQASAALFGSTGGKNKGNTRQGINAAKFLLGPQVSMAPALFGSTGEKKYKGKTGQGVSAADFLPAPQASTAWFGSAGGQTQGTTGQGVSAADFVYRPGGGTQDPFSLAALFGPPGRQSKKEANAHGARGSRYGLAGTQDPSSSAALFGPPGRQYEKEADAHGARGLRKGLAAA